MALLYPTSSSHHVASGGWGRFRLHRDKVLLSSSDDAGPSGRRYEVETGAWNVPENGLLALWLVAVAFWVWAVHCGWRPTFVVPWTLLVASLGLLWALGMVLRPVYWAGQFFETLWLPALWSVGMGWLALRRGGGAMFGLLLFSLLPAVAAYLHYAVGGASHPSFLVAGAVPWSDAWLHFTQAAQIGLFGVTDHAFNGRYFYPLALSAALWVAGWNLQLALALLFGLSLVGLALFCRVVRPMAGWAGTSLMALGCVLYLRAHVAGVCMSEALGFLAGVLGTTGLVLAAGHSMRWFLASLLLLSFGMAARPGALLVLPALGVCLAWSFASHRPARFLSLLAIAAALVLAPFALNAGLGRVLSTGGATPFNNFAFSLHGMLLGEGWEASTAQTGFNPGIAMQRSKELLVEKPWLLASGYARALDHVTAKKFLFRFGQERRLAATITVLAGIGLLGIWFMPAWRAQAPWMTFAAGGLLLPCPSLRLGMRASGPMPSLCPCNVSAQRRALLGCRPGCAAWLVSPQSPRPGKSGEK